MHDPLERGGEREDHSICMWSATGLWVKLEDWIWKRAAGGEI